MGGAHWGGAGLERGIGDWSAGPTPNQGQGGGADQGERQPGWRTAGGWGGGNWGLDWADWPLQCTL